MRLRTRGVLPGFGLAMGYALFYLGLLVLVPLGAMVLRASTTSFAAFWATVSDPRAVAAFRLSFGAAIASALLNAVFGMIVAWVLVRYEFPGKRIVDALVDLPFALPTAVAGIALTTVWAENGVLGGALARIGVKVAFGPIGIVVAMTFVGIPFVVRTVQPVLETLEPELEEAAAVLGATKLQTFVHVIARALVPSLLTGFALAFARALGEYGSIVFISGNMPMKTEIAPLLIVTKLEQYDYAGATAIATTMLALSFVLLLVINVLQRWTRRGIA
jgi:sulfate transport system permease protein